jgi:hypothetical protein
MKFIKELDYINVDKCIEQLKTFNISNIEHTNVNYKEEITLFHVYWYGKITRKQIASINSYLKTQDLVNTELWVWIDDSWHDFQINLIPKHTNIKIKKYEPLKESVNTLFEKKQYLVNEKFIKFRSDLARLIILYKYGGIYIDLDIFLLKDFTPLLRFEFCYSWSYKKAGNNAIVRLFRGSQNCISIMNKYCNFLKNYDKNFNFIVRFTHKEIYNDDLNIVCLPSILFDPVWVLFDTKSVSKYSNITNFDDFFHKTDEDITTFFDNKIYAYHWHSRNDFKIEKDSYFEKLEKL